jgi:hypothetical protein
MARRISNSEVSTFNICRAKYWYEYVENLAPKTYGRALAIGIVGHDAMRVYIEARIAGHLHESAIHKQQEFLAGLMGNPLYSVEYVLKASEILNKFHTYRKGMPEWEFLGTEELVEVDITEDYSMPLRYDLYVRERATDKFMLVDYKFVYDFWKPWKHDLNPQFPKYIAALRRKGMRIDGAYLIEMRTRDISSQNFADLFKQTSYFPSLAKMKNNLRQHINVSEQITEFRQRLSDTPDQVQNIAVPTLNSLVCQWCAFQAPCAAQLDGSDITYQLQTDFVKNTSYGYNKEDE